MFIKRWWLICALDVNAFVKRFKIWMSMALQVCHQALLAPACPLWVCPFYGCLEWLVVLSWAAERTQNFREPGTTLDSRKLKLFGKELMVEKCIAVIIAKQTKKPLRLIHIHSGSRGSVHKAPVLSATEFQKVMLTAFPFTHPVGFLEASYYSFFSHFAPFLLSSHTPFPIFASSISSAWNALLIHFLLLGK